MRTSTLLAVLLPALIATASGPSQAGGPLFRRRDRPVVETVDLRPENRLAPSPMLGTFRPTPYIYVRGNGNRGGGYSPVGFAGANTSMSLYGPFSALRATAAPVTTVVRGYDGVPVVVEGTSFSTPFQPSLSPVRYPTRATTFSGLRDPAAPPRSGSGIMWVDLN